MTESIVLNVCAECGVSAKAFFGPKRSQKLIAARRLAIVRLRDAGFSCAAIARLIRRNYSVVQYWMHPEYRERRVGYYKDYWAKRKHDRSTAAPQLTSLALNG